MSVAWMLWCQNSFIPSAAEQDLLLCPKESWPANFWQRPLPTNNKWIFANKRRTKIKKFSTYYRRIVRFLCLSVSLSVCLLACLPACLPVHLSTCPSICLSVCPSVCPSIRPSVHPSVCSSVCLSIRPSVHLSAHLSVCLSICPPVCLSVGLAFHTLDICSAKRFNIKCYQSYSLLYISVDKWILKIRWGVRSRLCSWATRPSGLCREGRGMEDL